MSGTSFSTDAGDGTVTSDGFIGNLTGNATGTLDGTLAALAWQGTVNVVAGGSNSQANATALSKLLNIVVTVTATTRAVKLISAAAGRVQFVFNSAATACKVYPATGDKIGAAATNAVSTNTIAPNKGVMFAAKDATTWIALRGA